MEEIKPGVWFVAAGNGGRYPFAHSLYLAGRNRTLIDTGAGPVLEQLVGRVDQVLLSHYHRDHLTGNVLFREAPFLIHPLDAPAVQTEQGFFQLSGVDRIAGGAFWEIVRQSGFKATAIAGLFKDGDCLESGSLTVRVLHAPGHTPGHCAFLIEEYELIFAADIDLTPFGPWYGNVSSDLEQFKRSIRRIRDLKPRLLLSAHCMPVTSGITARLDRFAAVIEQRDEALFEQLRRKPQTLTQLVDQKMIYGRHPQPASLYRFFEETMLRKHLDGLIEKGLVNKLNEQGCYEVL
ncbi:MAG: MBL fold metallo-hydrolase [Bacillota bacterium]